MASSQAVARKEEAALNELMKQAKEGKPQDEMIFGGWLYNNNTSKKPMKLHTDKIWSGDFHTKYPAVLEESASFVQTEKRENGIKTAVVYSLSTGEDILNQYGFLLAWSDSYTEGKHIRKVRTYVIYINILKGNIVTMIQH